MNKTQTKRKRQTLSILKAAGQGLLIMPACGKFADKHVVTQNTKFIRNAIFVSRSDHGTYRQLSGQAPAKVPHYGADRLPPNRLLVRDKTFGQLIDYKSNIMQHNPIQRTRTESQPRKTRSE